MYWLFEWRQYCELLLIFCYQFHSFNIFIHHSQDDNGSSSSCPVNTSLGVTTQPTPQELFTHNCQITSTHHHQTSPSISFQTLATAPKREKDAKRRVVITGMGLVSVFGNDVDTYYDRLLAGKSGIRFIDKFDASKFPTRFGGQIHGFKSNGYIDGKSDRRLDDYQRYCIVAGKKALEDAALGGDELSKSKIDKDRAGVVVGSAMGGVAVFCDGMESLMERGCRKVSPFFSPYILTNMGSALLVMDLGFMGPNYSISAACATSNFCLCAAANHIREGKADLMIAGGADTRFHCSFGIGSFFEKITKIRSF